MKIGIAIIIFFLAIITLVAEAILYFMFGIGAAFSGGNLEGIAAFFVSLMVLTIATGILAPICAIVELVVSKHMDIKKKKHEKHGIIARLFYHDMGSFLLISILAVILFFIILGFSLSSSTDTGTFSEEIQDINDVGSVPIEETTSAPIFQEENIGMLATVNSATKKNVIGDCGEYGFTCAKAASGNIFLIIDVTVENKGAQGYLGNYVSSYDFKIKDEEGFVYESSNNHYLDRPFSAGEIPVGDKVRGEVAFEIPKTATGLKFDFDGSIVHIN